MRKIINYVVKKEKLFAKIGIFAVLTLAFISCLHLRAVYFPEVVETNSTFEVKLVADMKNPLDDSGIERFGYGFVGVLLPVGWTIDNDDITYDYRGLDDEYDNEHVTGKMFFSEEMTEHCIEMDEDLYGDTYYWQGFRTDNRLHSGNMDSIVVVLKVTTNDVIGDYTMIVGIQETSYDQKEKDEDGNVIKDEDGNEIPIPEGAPGNTLRDNKPNDLFFKAGDPGSDQFCKSYLEIQVVEGDKPDGILEYSKKDQNTYTVSSLGDGRLLVNLLDELKTGATAIIYNINGQEIATQELPAMENILDVKLSQGVYFVAVQKDGVRSSKKVLVR